MKTAAFPRARLGLSIIVAIFLIGVIPSVAFSGGPPAQQPTQEQDGDGKGDVTPPPPEVRIPICEIIPEVRLSERGIISCTGFTPDGEVKVTFHRPDNTTSEHLGKADGYGNFDGTFTVASDRPTGEWTLYLIDLSTGQTIAIPFTVLPLIPPPPPPPRITNLAAIDAHDGKVNLTWIPSEVGDFAYYAIYVTEKEITTVSGLSPAAIIKDIKVHTYQVTGLRDGSRYYFAVTAVDVAGNEDKSVTSVSATPTDVTPPPPITNLAAIDAHDGNVNLTWKSSEVEDFAYYAIYVSEKEIRDVTGLSPITKIRDIEVHTYPVTGLKDGSRYDFAVTAVDVAGNEDKNVTAQSTVPTSTILLSLPALISPDTLVLLPAVFAGFAVYFLLTKGKKAPEEVKVTEVKVDIEVLRRKSI